MSLRETLQRVAVKKADPDTLHPLSASVYAALGHAQAGATQLSAPIMAGAMERSLDVRLAN